MSLRATNIGRLDGGHFDVLVVGGGINGAVSLAALAGRGARVALVERGDFGSFTSQETSNLVWGGFKYLENRELRLVRKLCRSRNRLIAAYPTRIQPIGFLAALDRSSPFPPWLAAIGSAAYWVIGGFATPRPRFLRPKRIKAEEPVVDIGTVRGGIEYFDAYLKDNDARFVFSFVRQALDHGATAANYVELVSAERDASGRWSLELVDRESGATLRCTADVLINAAGPFVDRFNAEQANRTEHRIVYSKGIHLVVPRLTGNERVLAFFDDSERLFYIIPMGARSVIGTTDERVDDPETEVTDRDRAFLLDQVNARLDRPEPLTVDDIIAERTGVRPLVLADDGDDRTGIDWTTLSRRHEVEVNRDQRLITIFGGKLTDCLNVGDEVAEVAEGLGVGLQDPNDDWFGEPGPADRVRYQRLVATNPVADSPPGVDGEPAADRLWRRYGQRAFALLEAVEADPRLARPVSGFDDLLLAEVEVAARFEMVTRLDDFLRRRTMLRMVTPEEELLGGPGVRQIAEVLFGSDANDRIEEYRSEASSLDPSTGH